MIGKKLNVETVLEGSVRKASNRLRITAQLIKTADGYHLWSDRYDRELDDVFAIQDEISLAILDRLQALKKQTYVPPSFVAEGYLALGEHEKMYALLEKAVRGNDPNVAMLTTWPHYDPVRSDSRFAELLKKVGRRHERRGEMTL